MRSSRQLLALLTCTSFILPATLPLHLILQVAEIVRRCPAKQLMKLYKVAGFEGPDQFLQLVAQVRGPVESRKWGGRRDSCRGLD